MAKILKHMISSYHWYLDEHSDHRTDHFPLMGSPTPSIIIFCIYIWFVKYAGPAFMEKREPFKLDRVIQVYNIVQISVCGSLSVYGGWTFYGPNGVYNWFCDEIDYGTDQFTMFTLKLFYIYYLLKILDLLDTVFFVLRKKNRQISFLHVYHHAFMVLVIYYAFKFLPGGHVVFLGFLNSFVHAVMYFYYLLSNSYKHSKSILWWKKYITVIQIVQFLLIIIHNLQMFVQPNCNYPKLPLIIFMPQNIFILFMFCDFYYKTYIKKPTNKSN